MGNGQGRSRDPQLNVRLPADRISALRLVAEIEGVTIRDLVLEGTDEVLRRRLQDEGWRQRAEAHEEEIRGAFDRLLRE